MLSTTIKKREPHLAEDCGLAANGLHWEVGRTYLLRDTSGLTLLNVRLPNLFQSYLVRAHS